MSISRAWWGCWLHSVLLLKYGEICYKNNRCFCLMFIVFVLGRWWKIKFPDWRRGSTSCCDSYIYLGGLPCQGGMLLAGTNRNLSVLNSRHVDWLSHIEDDGYFGWWFQMCFIFTPIWGRFPILMNIFQTGCNRQLVVDTARGEPLCKPNLCWTFVRFKQLCGGTSRELQTEYGIKNVVSCLLVRSRFQVKW